ncbi:hypothetical protein TNCV_2099421 [Trichonephila clavipes]|nr:hypothetical protein TNCV_2099421 [Trichonephila clavipes]
MSSLLKEVETGQAIEEPAEVLRLYNHLRRLRWLRKHACFSQNLKMGSEISRQIRKWEIVSTDDQDEDNGTKLLNYWTVIGP